MRPRQLNLFGIKKDKQEDPKREGIVIPIDTTILLVVVIILLLITVFSWGVERGRKSSLQEVSDAPEPEIKTESNIEEKIIAEKITEEAIINENSQSETNKEEIKSTGPLYRIQVASFKKLSSAEEEAKKLKEKGFSIEIEKKGKYSVIYVGKFENKAIAEENLKKLKNTYQDCLLRRL